MTRFVDIPSARARVRIGPVLVWSATLGATQAGLLIAAAHPAAPIAPAFVGLALVLGLAAAVVVATTWFVRMAVPVHPRAVGAIVPALFYGAAALASPQAHGLLAATLLAPAIAWAPWLPRGRFEIKASAGR